MHWNLHIIYYIEHQTIIYYAVHYLMVLNEFIKNIIIFVALIIKSGIFTLLLKIKEFLNYLSLC